MKKILLLTLIFLLINVLSSVSTITFALESAFATSDEEQIAEQFENINLDELSEYSEALGGLNIEDLASNVASGSFSLNPMKLFKEGVNLLLGEMKANLNLIIQILILAIIAGVLQNLQSSFNTKGVGEIAFYSVYIILAGLAVKVFIFASDAAIQFIDVSAGFVNKIIPPLMILLASSGAFISGTVLQPAIVVATQAITFIIKEFFLPLCLVGVVLSIAGNLSTALEVSQLVKFINNIIKWGLGILLTVFVGIVSINAMFAPTLDGRAIMVGEYAVKSFVPVIGSILADTVGLIAGCAKVVRSAVGIAGMVGFCTIASLPIIKIIAQIGIMQIASAVIQPISDRRLVKCLSDLSGGLTLILVMMLSLTVMFFVNIALVIQIGGANGLY